MKTVLSIAGSDPSGGAGIQADIKTITMFGAYAMSVITAVTAQNTTGVRLVTEVDADTLKAQLDAVFDDIKPDSVKIGMICSAAQARIIADCLKSRRAKNIVIDPVISATDGNTLCRSEAVEIIKEQLFPISALITPNIPEAQQLTGINIHGEEEMLLSGKRLFEKYGCAVLVKGGHLSRGANDLLYGENGCGRFRGERIDTGEKHGTGCTLSSAIAAGLARGLTLKESVGQAKDYLTAAMKRSPDLGHGNSPLCHNYSIL